MSQGSSNPTSPSRPVPASDQQETVTPVSHVFGLSEVSASLEALNIEVERKPTMVHRAQTSYSPGASRTPWSPNARDNWRSTQASPYKPKRYALQIWLEVEVGPGYFLPPEDDSCSTDFALEVLNRAYPGCTGVYLDREAICWLSTAGRAAKSWPYPGCGHKAGHTVTEIPTWMGLTAKWRVKCVSLTEAKDILAVCKRLKQEKSEVGTSILSGTTHLPAPTLWCLSYCSPFQPRAAIPTPRPAETASDQHKAERRGPKASLSPSLARPPPQSVKHLHP